MDPMLLYSPLLCKKIERVPGGVKYIIPLSWGLRAKQIRS